MELRVEGDTGKDEEEYMKYRGDSVRGKVCQRDRERERETEREGENQEWRGIRGEI
jgi:hypothetical protein